MSPPDDTDRQAEAKAVMARATRETEALGHSSLSQRAADHFSGRDAVAEGSGDDPIEVWGRRIGRGLSVVGALILTWTLGWQLGWW